MDERLAKNNALRLFGTKRGVPRGLGYEHGTALRSVSFLTKYLTDLYLYRR
jgi:hypothetical protein